MLEEIERERGKKKKKRLRNSWAIPHAVFFLLSVQKYDSIIYIDRTGG